LAKAASVSPHDAVTSFGFPQGVPLKIDPRGEILSVDRTGFDLRTDAYGGSSGSGIYDGVGDLLGILTSGQSDLTWDASRKCRVSRVIPADAGSSESERGMHVGVALARACFRSSDLEFCARATGNDGSTEASDTSSSAAAPAEVDAGLDQGPAPETSEETEQPDQGPSPDTLEETEDLDDEQEQAPASAEGAESSIEAENSMEVDEQRIASRRSASCSFEASPHSPTFANASYLVLLGLWFLRRRRDS
jgi:hypothetical protein